MAKVDDMSLYSDQPMEEEAGMEMADAESEGETTAILPMEILAGKQFEPGDSVILRIVALHDDSVEVAYDFESGDEEIEGEMAPPMTDEMGMADLMG